MFAVLTQAVKNQMMSDVPIGLLLSVGLGPAVISSIIKPMLEETKQEYITGPGSKRDLPMLQRHE